jgi:peptide methionine sulfoxide reductase MsrA
VGGEIEWPTYSMILDYTEGVTVTFDQSRITYDDLLDFYFAHHDWKNSCSNYRQYMAGVWWHNRSQQLAVEQKIGSLENETGSKVVSFNGPLNIDRIYRAEEYHQQYYDKSTFGTSLPSLLGNQQTRSKI